VSGAILPARTSAPISSRGNSATSNMVPCSIFLFSTEVRPNAISTFVPLAASNSGTASSIRLRMAPPLNTVIVPDATKVKNPPPRGGKSWRDR
jgi:hypothetical protein